MDVVGSPTSRVAFSGDQICTVLPHLTYRQHQIISASRSRWAVVFATLVVLRATVVQTPTANPIVAASARDPVTRHLAERQAYLPCEVRSPSYELCRFLGHAWHHSLPERPDDTGFG